jgi:hypothetical protein
MNLKRDRIRYVSIMKINYLLSQVGSLMIPFDEFQTKFFNIFTTNNFYDGKSYLEYIAEPQTNR